MFKSSLCHSLCLVWQAMQRDTEKEREMNFMPSTLRPFGSFRCDSPPILSFLYSFTIYIVGSRIGMQIESGAHRIKHTDAAGTDRAFELAFLLARMTTTITASAKQRITKQRRLCVCFETIYFIQNLFVIRVDLCARAGSTVHSPRSVKRNFHLSLLYCYLDGRQEIVLLVLGSFSPHPHVHPSTRGQSVRVVHRTHDASINFRLNMENKLHIICIQWTIVVANLQWIKWQSHRIRQPQNLPATDASRRKTIFCCTACCRRHASPGPTIIFNLKCALQINRVELLSKHKLEIAICIFFKYTIRTPTGFRCDQAISMGFQFSYSNVAVGRFAAI